MTEELEDYILSHIDEEGEHLARLNRETHIYHLRPRMCSGHLQGRLLKMFVRMINPRNILELGTFTGYSGLCLAEGLIAPDGELHTIEIDDELEDFIRSHFEASAFADRIHLHIGDAREILPSLGKTFDLVFMDGDKRQYMQYYEMVMQHTTPNAIILADNTLWDGHVVDKAYENDRQTNAINEFNAYLAADQRVEKFILPLRDGLTMIRKK
jgi:predicted O-methyltransferase YrrM